MSKPRPNQEVFMPSSGRHTRESKACVCSASACVLKTSKTKNPNPHAFLAIGVNATRIRFGHMALPGKKAARNAGTNKRAPQESAPFLTASREIAQRPYASSAARRPSFEINRLRVPAPAACGNLSRMVLAKLEDGVKLGADERQRQFAKRWKSGA